MSFQDKINQAVGLAEGLLTQVTEAFPAAAAEVAENVAHIRAEMKAELTEVVGFTKERAETIVELATSAWPFPRSKDTAKQDHFQLYRHVRDGSVDELGKATISPSGGLSFFIDVQHKPKPVLTFAVSVQEPGKNFRYRLGRDESKGRFEHNQTITVEYNPSVSLLSNIQEGLDEVVAQGAADPAFKATLTAAKIDYTKVCMAANMLRAYTESLPRENPGDPK